MSKHTKGPWQGKAIRVYDEHTFGLDIGYMVTRDEFKREEGRANARLIAAAPELLEALEALVLFTKPTKSNAVALNNAHNIIAKARGEA